MLCLPRAGRPWRRGRAWLLWAPLLVAGLVAADAPFHTDLDSYQQGRLGTEPNQTFHSAPDVVAPVYQINTFDASKVDASAASAYLFMAGRQPGVGWGPSIVSSRDLSLVWSDLRHGALAQATSTFLFRGERVLATFYDDAVHIIAQDYRELHVVRPVGELSRWRPDSHEAMLTDDDTVLLIVCPDWAVDLTPVGGPAEGGLVANCAMQEVDPVTSELLFEWTTLDYFTVADSLWAYHNERVWDFAHMNSVQKTADGDYLISYRHLSAVVLVDGRSGAVRWVMGGKRNQFTDISPRKTGRRDASAAFRWQHNPRVTGINRFTLFDNHRLDNGYCWSGVCSRGLELEYDPVARTVWLLNEWTQPQGVVSASRGSVQRTHGGSALLAFGQNPVFTEYTPTGDLAMDFQRGQVLTIDHGIENVVAYRVAKGPWVGRPPWGPNISCLAAADAGGGGGAEPPHRVYVSWNGATEVDRYVLLTADAPTDLDGPAAVVAQSPRNGFETEFAVRGYALRQYARVAALDAAGAILGATPAVDTATGELQALDYAVTRVAAADATALAPSLPSSAAAAVPSGTHATRPPAVVHRRLSTGQTVGVVLGSVGGGLVVIAAAVVGLMRWLRRRRRAAAATAMTTTPTLPQQKGAAGDDADADAAQGLLDASAFDLDSLAARHSSDSEAEVEAYGDR